MGVVRRQRVNVPKKRRGGRGGFEVMKQSGAMYAFLASVFQNQQWYSKHTRSLPKCHIVNNIRRGAGRTNKNLNQESKGVPFKYAEVNLVICSTVFMYTRKKRSVFCGAIR